MILVVWLALEGLLAATVWLAGIDLGGANLAVALAIAAIKATLVALFFMRLRSADLPTRGAAVACALLLVALLSLTALDYCTRP